MEFVVVDLQEGPGRNVYDVILRDATSDEGVIWRVPSNTLNNLHHRLPFNISLVGKARRMPFIGQNVYELEYDKTIFPERLKGAKEYRCDAAQLKLVNDFIRLRLEWLLTLTDTNGKTSIQSIPTDINDTGISFFSDGGIWCDATQYAEINPVSSPVNIDYTVVMSDYANGSPFDFEEIVAHTTMLVYPAQTLATADIVPDPTASVTPAEAMKAISKAAKLAEGTRLNIADIVKVGGKEYYKCVVQGYAFYLPASDVTIDTSEKAKLGVLANADTSKRDGFFRYTKARSLRNIISYIDDINADIDKYSSKGLSVANISISHPTIFTRLDIVLYCSGSDIIKEASLTVQGYDSNNSKCGDPVKLKCQSDIIPGEMVPFIFPTVWQSNDVKSVKVLSINYTIKSGKTVNIPDGAKAVWPGDLYTEAIAMIYLQRLKRDIK